MNISGWGRGQWIDAQIFSVNQASLMLQQGSTLAFISRGLGRSYGDSSLGKNVIISTEAESQLLGFDEGTGILWCEGGVSIKQILRIFIPKGWFLPVTPGTQYVTVGGAIASDVHGKNHHNDGSFSNHIIEMEMLLGDGNVVSVSRVLNGDLFYATCGGMGLTGIVLSAKLQLKRINSTWIDQKKIATKNLRTTFDSFDSLNGEEYVVEWLDSTANGSKLGRSILMSGNHKDTGGFQQDRERLLQSPERVPNWILNNWNLKIFNQLYYKKQSAYSPCNTIGIKKYFYPLDSIENWNRLYGKNGFLQYQFVVPIEVGYEAISFILRKINAAGYASFLTVLKKFGIKNKNLLSFPTEGYTLALDFKIDIGLLKLLNDIDAMVCDYGGKIYLAKDSRMSQQTFRMGYKDWEKFEEVRVKYKAVGCFASLQSKRLGLL